LAPAHELFGLASAAVKRRHTRPAGYPVAGTKMEEKENFRVQFLHTFFHNHLILFIYLAHPSSAQ
jgi:hypothetical protein